MIIIWSYMVTGSRFSVPPPLLQGRVPPGPPQPTSKTSENIKEKQGSEPQAFKTLKKSRVLSLKPSKT